MNVVNISLSTLKEIVTKAEQELGGTNGTVYVFQDTNNGGYGTREKYYKPSLSRHSLEIEKGRFYEEQTLFSQLVIKH